MTSRPRPAAALVSFARAYLHQDFVEEYHTVAGAAAAFAAEATPRERAALRAAVDAWIARSADWPIALIRDYVTTELRSAWVPASRRELTALRRALDVEPPVARRRR